MKRLPYTSPVRFIYLSIAASVTTLLLKGIAYYLTGSIGLLSDALESIINLAAAIMALILITIASSPPDKNHPFGHGKAEYFSSVIEGTLILCAAIAIGVTSVERIINPHELQKLGSGLIISGIASLINLLTGVTLVRKGRLHRSITLEADGRHLLTDVWTTAGVLVALLIVKLTGLTILDPLIGIGVAINIIVTGIRLIKRSVSGLMDQALCEEDIALIKNILNRYVKDKIIYHSLYTRQAGKNCFISLHLLMPGSWHISKGHEITKKIESEIKKKLAYSEVFIHIEPTNDPDSFDDYLSPETPDTSKDL